MIPLNDINGAKEVFKKRYVTPEKARWSRSEIIKNQDYIDDGFNACHDQYSQVEVGLSKDQLIEYIDIALTNRELFKEKAMSCIKNRPKIPRMGDFIADLLIQKEREILVVKKKGV